MATTHMKTTALAALFSLLNIKLNLVPNVDLYIVMGLLIVFDLITGVIKAVFQKKARTSEGYRRTVVKFLQYGGALVVGLMIKFLSLRNHELGVLSEYVDYINNGLLVFIILIETTSIFENLYAIDKTTPFSKNFIQPILRVLTFQLNKGPLKTKDEKEVTNEG